jgi:tripartite-type tricarboxylate transporter receptor subunit TctC
MRNLILASLAAASWLCTAPAAGQPADSWPGGPVRLVVPFAAGGPSDMFARMLADPLGEAWRQQVEVENVAGQGGYAGMQIVAKAAADGRTLALSTSTDAIAAATDPAVPYDVTRDLRQVALIAQSPFVVAAGPGLAAANLAEAADLARARPGEIGMASAGIGVPSYMAGLLLQRALGVTFLDVTFKGQGPAIQAVASGAVPLGMMSPSTALGLLSAGKLRALAATSARRLAVLPAVPTVAELGHPGFEVSIWFGVQAPAATPEAVVRRVAADVARAMEREDVRARLAASGVELLPGGPEEYARLLRADIAKWAETARAAGIAR